MPSVKITAAAHVADLGRKVTVGETLDVPEPVAKSLIAGGFATKASPAKTAAKTTKKKSTAKADDTAADPEEG